MLGYQYAIKLREAAEKVKYSSHHETVRKNDIHNSLQKCMVDQLQTLIIEEVHNSCNGCQIDHPSQIEHPVCLFMNREEHTDLFIERAMLNVNPYKIMETWYPQLEELKLNEQESVEAYRLWQSIKRNILFGFTDSWLNRWCEKVKHSWN